MIWLRWNVATVKISLHSVVPVVSTIANSVTWKRDAATPSACLCVTLELFVAGVTAVQFSICEQLNVGSVRCTNFAFGIARLSLLLRRARWTRILVKLARTSERKMERVSAKYRKLAGHVQRDCFVALNVNRRFVETMKVVRPFFSFPRGAVAKLSSDFTLLRVLLLDGLKSLTRVVPLVAACAVQRWQFGGRWNCLARITNFQLTFQGSELSV